MTHIPHDAVGPVLGFVGAGISAGVIKLAQAMPAEIKGWFEGGAYLMLVGCLIYAVITLWRRLDTLQKDVLTDWKEQNRKLIETLNKLDPDS